VSVFIAAYLDSIDESLLDYFGEDEELRPEMVKRLRYCASATAPALSSKALSPWQRAEEWADWFGAFVAAFAALETEGPVGLGTAHER
jgi:hypothetical protein